MSQLSLVQTIAIWILPLLTAITLHEVAHGGGLPHFAVIKPHASRDAYHSTPSNMSIWSGQL